MILSVSRRTDIPCFYARWFLNRLRAGYVLVPNPYNRQQLSRVPLEPDTLDCIVFWTKDPAPLLPFLSEIDRMGYPYCFQFTLTPYGQDIEGGLRPKVDILQTFQELARRVGRERMQWRYDPILLSGEWTVQRHAAAFARMCRALAPYAAGVTISFLDMYRRTETAGLRPLSAEEREALSRALGPIAAGYGLPVQTCCEEIDLSAYGIRRGGCISRELLERTCGGPLSLSWDRNQRPGCMCVQSIDIGTYDTCPHGCIYCYATRRPAAARRAAVDHDPEGELLTGRLAGGERIVQRQVRRLRQDQLRLLD